MITFLRSIILETEHLGSWKCGNLQIQNFMSQHIQTNKYTKSKSMSPQNVGKVRINRENNSWPHWCHFKQIFPWTKQNAKTAGILLTSLGGQMGPIHPAWALAAIHPWWQIGRTGKEKPPCSSRSTCVTRLQLTCSDCTAHGITN